MGRVKVPVDRAFGAGSVKQRDVDAAVNALGGRKSKAFQTARDFGDVARRAGEAQLAGGKPLANRVASSRWNRALTALENATSGSRAAILAKASLRGLLSPAGLAEGVAGATVKAMKASGAYDKPMKVMQSKSKTGKPGTRKGERA